MSEKSRVSVNSNTPGKLAGRSVLQRKCDCGTHTVAGAECAECGKNKNGLQHEATNQRAEGASFPRPGIPVIQRKLTIGTTNDPLEQEAERAPGLQFDFTRIPVTALPIQSKPIMNSTRESFGAQATLELETGQRLNEEPRPSVNTNQSAHSLPFLDPIQRSFGRYDVSHIRAHTGTIAAAEAVAIGADAFARGSDVTFSRTPSLHTTAHEAAHVIQQRVGVDVTGGMGQEGDAYERHADEVANRVVRGQSSEDLLDAHPGAAEPRRDVVQGSVPAHEVAASRPPVTQLARIPPNIRALLTASGGGNAANFAADAEGALRLINRAMDELTHVQRVSVLQKRRGALTEAQFELLPRRERRIRHAEAILALFTDRQLSDPGDASLTDSGARPATADAANIATVVTNANTIFADIATGARDAWLTDVFGAGSVGAAKAKYALGRTAMNRLNGTGSIVTDRSGYSEEVFLGGLTDLPTTPLNPNQKIRVKKGAIDNPNLPDSITTLLHESMHAGNADVHDQYTGFQTETEPHKLTFSSCFEVVPWRILDPTNPSAFTGETFIPAGTSIPGVGSAPALTSAEEGAKAARELFRGAWTNGLRLHRLYVDLFRTPTNWTVPPPGFGGKRFDNSLPFWSKVQQLTIHQKTTIDPASPDEAKHPVSQIDIALSEGLTRKLGFGLIMLSPLQQQADILTFETANSTAAERSTVFPGGAHTSINTERDFLLKLTARHQTAPFVVAPMTGPVARDCRVVRELGSLNWANVLDPRSPASFAD